MAWLIGDMPNWMTNVRDLPGREAIDLPTTPRRRGAFTREIVEAATSRSARERWRSAVRCIARVGRKICRGWVYVLQASKNSVDWWCEKCGEQGVVTGFEGSDLDFSRYRSGGKMVMWGIDDEEREVLVSATAQLPALRAVIARARPHADVEGLVLVEATVPELDQIYTLVEDLTDIARAARRIELLDGLRTSLCTSMDGF